MTDLLERLRGRDRKAERRHQVVDGTLLHRGIHPALRPTAP